MKRVTHELEDAGRTRCGLSARRLFIRFAEVDTDPSCVGCMHGRGRDTVKRLRTPDYIDRSFTGLVDKRW